MWPRACARDRPDRRAGCSCGTTAGRRLLLRPFEQPGRRPGVDHARRGNAGEPRVRQRIILVPQLAARMRVAVEREQAAGVERLARERVIQVLAIGIAVELDRDLMALRFSEYLVPARDHP